jgi:Flp pilus assembly protein TadG
MKNKWVRYALILRNKNESGAVIVMVAIVLIVLIAIAALAVDVGYLMASRNELQNAADASALASTRQLGAIYKSMSPAAQQTYVYVYDPGNSKDVIEVAKAAALSNSAAGQPVTVLNADVEVGTWDQARNPRFVATTSQPDAVRVTTRRDPSVAAGQVGTFFARIFGSDLVSVTATATAALTGQSKVDAGGLPIPIGIPRRWFETPDFCGQSINFYPPCNREPCSTGEGCAGYHTFTYSNANANYIAKTIMPGTWQGTFISPAITAGTTQFSFTGGTLASLMNPPDYPFQTLFNNMKERDGDGNPNVWTAQVVVYDSSSCENPNQTLEIIGFATIEIDEVVGAPNPTVRGRVICDFKDQRGGGGNYGTKGTIPGLVQ